MFNLKSSKWPPTSLLGSVYCSCVWTVKTVQLYSAYVENSLKTATGHGLLETSNTEAFREKLCQRGHLEKCKGRIGKSI